NLTSKIQAGRYEIPLTLTPIQVVELLQHGTFDVRLTFLEGWRREQYLEYALSKLAVDNDVFSAEFLEETESLEGYLFPDTYSVSIDTTAKNLVAKLRSNFDKRYNENIIALEKKSGLSKSQIVIIASLLERESVGDREELGTIGGILIKRWKAGWYLGVDATVQYALGRHWNAEKGWEWWKDDLTSQDLKIDSPYNTYKLTGLPPAPIASPGLDALSAAAAPLDSPYWFYLHAKIDGKIYIYYAKTLEEHNQNVAKYLK
ncbi:MAG: endolytic transglycosylase MltG, partial [candidate division WWE3 bacterium]|nr:endolytic transglycosylase MltG [candidate division WWE3 bacterium]